MFRVDFRDIDTNVFAHRLEAEIIDIDFSALEIESEVAGFRTPQSATIQTKKTTWLRNNILAAPKNTIAAKQVLRYRADIFYAPDGVTFSLYRTMFVLMDLLQDQTDSEVAFITCYDSTKLLELWSDSIFASTPVSERVPIDDVLAHLTDKIATELGFSYPSPTIETPIIQKGGSLEIGRLKLNEESEINRLFDATNPSEMQRLMEDDSISELDITTSPSTYASRRDLIKIGFKNDPEAEAYPVLKVMALSVWQLRHPGIGILPPPGSGWIKRPRYIAMLTVWDYQVYNYVTLTLTNKSTFRSRWAYCQGTGSNATPSIQLLWNAASVGSYQNVLRYGRFGLDEQNQLADSTWTDLIQQFNLENNKHASGSYTPNSGLFISTIFTTFATSRDCSVPMGGTIGCSREPGYTTDMTALNNIGVFRNGNQIPYTFNLPGTDVNALATLKTMLYVRNQSLFAGIDGSINIVTLTRDVDTSALTLIQNNSIFLLSKIHSGMLPRKGRKITGLFGDSNVLTDILSDTLKTWRVRRKVALQVDRTDIDILDNVNIFDEFAGFVSSVRADLRRNRSELIVSVVDIASIEFTISEPVLGLFPGVGITIDEIGTSRVTDSSGEATFFNVPLGTLNYSIIRQHYTTITGTVNVVDEIPYFVAHTMTPALISPPTITPLQATNQPTLISMVSDDNYSIYYTTDGTAPDPGVGTTQEYTAPFYILATSTVRAIAQNEIGTLSTIAIQADIPSDPVLEKPTIQQLFDVTERDAALVKITHPDQKAVIRYTLDGTDPISTSPEYRDELKVSKDFLQSIKAKAFFDSIESDTEEYYQGIATEPHDRDTLIRDIVVASRASESVVLQLPEGTYGLRITVLMNMYVQEDILGTDVQVIMTACRQIQGKIGTLALFGSAAIYQNYHSNDTIYGSIYRYEDGVNTADDDLVVGTAELMLVDVVGALVAGEFRLTTTIENTLTNLAATCSDLTDADVRCRLIVEPMRLDMP